MTLIHIRGKSLTLFLSIFFCYALFFSVNKVFFVCFFSGGGYSGNQENRYVGFGNTVTPEKKEDDFINNAMSSIYSVRHTMYGYDINGNIGVFFFPCNSFFLYLAGLEQFHCWS